MAFSLATLLAVSVIVLCLGALLGAVISRKFLPPEAQRDLEVRLQTARNELAQYQQDVTKHFAETSMLVNNLTRAYKDVHDHLAQGALQLANAEISRQILDAGDGKLGLEENDTLAHIRFEPPKDWAPKPPGRAGTLSEEFGLDESTDEESIETLTATQRRK